MLHLVASHSYFYENLWRLNTQHNDIQHNDTEHINKYKVTLSIIVECCCAVSFIMTIVYADCRKLTLNAECHYAECRYAECRGTNFIV
jgi:hypothetical protein